MKRNGWFFLLTALFVLIVPWPCLSIEKKIIDFGPKLNLLNFYGVWANGENNVWVVGNFGNIFHSKDGKIFKNQLSSVKSELYDIGFANESRGWIVGRHGIILMTEDGGRTWKIQKQPTKNSLFSLCVRDDRHAWAVGEWGTILHTNDGQTWVLQRKNVDFVLNDVSFVDLDYGWAVGEYGTILHTKDGGRSWVSQSSPWGKVTIFSVSFENRSQGVISAMDGRMLVTTNGGRTWVQAKSPTNKTILSIQFVKGKVYGVGLEGTSIISADGGRSYSSLNLSSGFSQMAWFSRCRFVNGNVGWIVGGSGNILQLLGGGKEWKRPEKLVFGNE